MSNGLKRELSSFRRESRGVAAIEFALVATFLVVGLLNAIDFGYYMYQRMQVENAARVGAQAAWKTCSQVSMLPATQNCQGLNAAVTAALQTTSLGASVQLGSGYPTEGYYCVNASHQLQSVGSLSSKPADCSAVGDSTTSPGDYVQIQATYNYTPLFGMSVMSASGISSISKISWTRLG